jgi:phosphatidylserine/phosphatidylglycerophosphate/cardiolipin synthase-like enzyme
MFRTISRMFGFSRAWRGFTIRPKHVFRAGFLTSAISAYPVAAYFGLVPQNINSAVQWFTGAGAAATTSLLPGTDASSKFGQTPGLSPSAEKVAKDIVTTIEDIGAQAVANTLTPNSYPTSAYPTAANPGAVNPPAGYPYNYPPGYAGANYGNAGANYGYAPGDIACYFSPGGGCTEAVVNEIRQARQQIFVQAYSFTSVPIANALVEAHNRGVAVYIVLDKSQKTEQYSGADFVAHAGIPTLIDSAHAIAHNKVMLIDHQTLITGSFNFTTSAEKSNAENLLIIRGRPDLYQAYENNFRHHYEHSQPYQGRGATTAPTRSFMPTTNNYAPNNLPATNNYAAPYGYPPSNNYSQGNYDYGNHDHGPSAAYPQMAAPQSYAPAGYRY